MAFTVLVPSADAVPVFREVEGLRPVQYDVAAPLPPEAADAEALVVPIWPTESARAVVGRLPRLRLVQTLTAGVDGWRDVLPEGAVLSCARGAHGGSTAEWAMTALLTVYRQFPSFLALQAERRWEHRQVDTLQGKRVLVIGSGDLGNQLRRRLAAFDAVPTMVGRAARDGVHGVDALPELLPAQDAVVVVVPLTDETRGLVDAEFLARMPDGAILVNAARGPVVDTDALLAELTRGRLRAVLDVTDPEPLPADHPLWTAPGVIITPHVGGNSRGQEVRAFRVAAEQIAAFAAGRTPDNLVTGAY
ncbi:2-hydroxyacid dehydrogenase [Streptoalloteichus hindustanus]|uniref:Phosphoglycerate dehydrogenase n=1 Tax=Streptoalloteichus hindustanus TaxID=2017 RepID=A0A1M5GPZ7_STRHI|nr:2-hydroxyacid dehydrogenase [Streptoalloteichus hindustanus]SHG05718.1 Phosphoglycerate dehydrogenase [Streptoalloteichus hindustanus]